jgi:hypothetical protein
MPRSHASIDFCIARRRKDACFTRRLMRRERVSDGPDYEADGFAWSKTLRMTPGLFRALSRLFLSEGQERQGNGEPWAAAAQTRERICGFAAVSSPSPPTAACGRVRSTGRPGAAPAARRRRGKPITASAPPAVAADHPAAQGAAPAARRRHVEPIVASAPPAVAPDRPAAQGAAPAARRRRGQPIVASAPPVLALDRASARRTTPASRPRHSRLVGNR